MVNVAERAQHQKDCYVCSCIVDRNWCAGDLNTPFAACCHVDIIVSSTIVAHKLQALWQHFQELIVEIPGQWVRVVAAIQHKHTVEFAILAPSHKVCTIAFRVLMKFRSQL